MNQLQELARTCASMYRRGLVSSTGGNASVRLGDSVFVTRTGTSLEATVAEDLVEVELDGTVLGGGQPSKEIPFHLAVYQARPDVGCVLHGHSPFAVAASTFLKPDDLNAFPVYSAGYMSRVGRLPLLPYLPSGSPELADGVGRVFAGDTKAVLLQNHGFIAAGADPATSFNTADELLDALQVWVLTRGEATPLHSAAEWPLGRAEPTEVSA
jgi:ribulose-5-phosphate 4-epimerase/fuculose-1-phosphate aldolase